MGRKSRHKLERRLGQAQSTPKQVEHARLKAQRRARNIPPPSKPMSASLQAARHDSLRHSSVVTRLGSIILMRLPNFRWTIALGISCRCANWMRSLSAKVIS